MIALFKAPKTDAQKNKNQAKKPATCGKANVSYCGEGPLQFLAPKLGLSSWSCDRRERSESLACSGQLRKYGEHGCALIRAPVQPVGFVNCAYTDGLRGSKLPSVF